MALASLIDVKGADLEGARIVMYSYGSGLAAGMFVLRGRSCAGEFSLRSMQSKVRLHAVRAPANWFSLLNSFSMLRCKGRIRCCHCRVCSSSKSQYNYTFDCIAVGTAAGTVATANQVHCT